MKIGQWERGTIWLLTAAAAVFLGVYAAPVIWPTLPQAVPSACFIAAWATWTLFEVDFACAGGAGPRPLRLVELVKASSPESPLQALFHRRSHHDRAGVHLLTRPDRVDALHGRIGSRVRYWLPGLRRLLADPVETTEPSAT